MDSKKLISWLLLTVTFVTYTPSYGMDQTLTKADSSVLQAGRFQKVTVNPQLYHLICKELIPTVAPISQFRDALDHRDGTSGRTQSLDTANTMFLNIIEELYFYMTLIDDDSTMSTKPIISALIHRTTMTQYRRGTSHDIPKDTVDLKRYFHDALALMYYEYGLSLSMNRMYDLAKNSFLKAHRFKHSLALNELSELHRSGFISLSAGEKLMVPLHLESIFYILCDKNSWSFPLMKDEFRFSYGRPTLEVSEPTRLDNGLVTQKVSNRSYLWSPCIWIRPLVGLEAMDCCLDNETGTIETYFLIIGNRLIVSSPLPKTLIIRGGHLSTDQNLTEPQITRKP